MSMKKVVVRGSSRKRLTKKKSSTSKLKKTQTRKRTSKKPSKKKPSVNNNESTSNISTNTNPVNSNPSGSNMASTRTIVQQVSEDYTLDASDPILDEVQNLLTVQNQKRVEGLKIEKKEKGEVLKKTNEDRERIGVELYQRQQQLATSHETNEKCDENLNHITQVRSEAEEKRLEKEKEVQEAKLELSKHTELSRHYKMELDRLNFQLAQIKKEKEDIESKVLIKQTGTYKNEEQMKEIENKKKQQDFLIDELNGNIKSMQESIFDINERYEEQKKETERAKNVLAESKIEFEDLLLRKKAIGQQWKMAVIGMQKRDLAHEKLQQELNQTKAKSTERENEIEATKKLVQEERDTLQDESEKLLRKENEEEALDKDESKFDSEREQIEMQNVQLMKMMEKVEAQLRDEEERRKSILKEINLNQKRHLEVSNEVRKMSQKKLDAISEELTFKRGTQSVSKEVEKISERIRERENDVANLENEIARVKIDLLQTETHNEELKAILKALEKELSDKVQMIEKYKTEIKKKNDEIEKKQSDLDKANRELERLRGNQQEENFGPLEAEIHNLQREIIQMEKQNEQLNKNWIRHQSQLVDLLNKKEGISLDLKELNAKRTILYQKSVRLNNRSRDEDDEIKELNDEIKKMHDSTVKLNNVISKHGDLQKILADENFDLENAVRAKIAEKEKEIRKIDNSIKNTMRKKQELTSQLLEIEKQIMFWEKKIELQLEIQKTLDPEVGQAEIRKMKKEIHMMQQKKEKLERTIKKRTEEMKLAIVKRSHILKKETALKNRNASTRASVKNKRVSAEEYLKKKKKEKQRRLNDIKELIRKTNEIAQENGELNRFCQEKENELKDIELKNFLLKLKKTLYENHFKKEQEAIIAIQKNEFKIQKKDKILTEMEIVKEIINQISSTFPQMNDQLKMMKDYLISD